MTLCSRRSVIVGGLLILTCYLQGDERPYSESFLHRIIVGPVASASLVAALFIPDRFTSDPSQIIHGVHQAFIVLGGLTVLSTIVFRELKSTDGDNVSRHNAIAPEGPQEIAVAPAAATLPPVGDRTPDRASV